MTKRQSPGFSVIEAVVILVVVLAAAFGGWYVWHKNKAEPAKQSNNTTQKNTNNKTSSDIPEGWVWYENSEMGLKVAYPKTWTIGTPTPVAAINGHDGISISITPPVPANGDPGVGFSSFPVEANVKDTDPKPGAVKVLTFVTGDGQTVTLVGSIDQPSSATKPTYMGVTACWPRGCSPILKDGRSLSMYFSAINNDCQPHVACFTELNANSSNYSIAIEILKTVTSL